VPVAVIASTNAWQAYNHFAGLSNYIDTATPQPLRLVMMAARRLNLRWPIGAKYVFPIVPLPVARPNPGLDIDLADIEAFKNRPAVAPGAVGVGASAFPRGARRRLWRVLRQGPGLQ
jgi:hypothetical protein